MYNRQENELMKKRFPVHIYPRDENGNISKVPETCEKATCEKLNWQDEMHRIVKLV